MIYLKSVKRFCREYWLIENYDQAMADKTQTWHCHHKKEIELGVGRKELIDMGLYYNQPAEDLIFLTESDHKKLHHAGMNHPMFGKHLTEEWKQNISNSRKGKRTGENHPNYGKEGYWKGKKREPFSEETKQKMSDGHTKYQITKEELYQLYVVQGLSQDQIAAIYGCHQTTILLKLRKFNIKK